MASRIARRASVRVLTAIFSTAILLIAVAAPGSTPRKAAAASTVTTIRQFETTQPVIALTFDCGSDRGYAAQILDTLKAKGAHATFGMTGLWAQSNPDLVRRMVAEGHQLINHTWDHQSFTGYSTGAAPLSAAQIASELDRADELVYSQTGTHMAPYFRPPYGDYSDASLLAAGAAGYRYSIMWTVDTLGWNGASVSEITSRALAAAAPGAIVLMHVDAESQDATALPGMIDALRARGYTFATVAEFVSGNLGTTQRYFPETGHWVSHGFRAYWQQHGGLAIFGYPISEEFTENGVTVQYFERQRLEWHPENPPAWQVEGGLLGSQVLAMHR